MNRKVIVSKGERRFPNREDQHLLETVRRQQCLIAGKTTWIEQWKGVYPEKRLERVKVMHLCEGFTEAHHPVSKARGGYDADTVPLCKGAHRELHQIGQKAFNLRWGTHLKSGPT